MSNETSHAGPAAVTKGAAAAPPPEPPRGRRDGARRSLFARRVPFVVAVPAALVVPLLVFAIVAERATRPSWRSTKGTMRTLRHATEAWRSQHDADACPDFARLVADRAVERGPAPRDEWGTPFRITCAGEETSVRSAGRDRRFDTADDLVIPEPDDAAR